MYDGIRMGATRRLRLCACVRARRMCRPVEIRIEADCRYDTSKKLEVCVLVSDGHGVERNVREAEKVGSGRPARG